MVFVPIGYIILCKREVFAPLKRFLCAVIVAALLLFCVACGSHAAVSADSIATAAPTASSSRNIRSEPITVNSTVADADTVNNAQTAAPTTEVTEAPAESEAEEVDTPLPGIFRCLTWLLCWG